MPRENIVRPANLLWPEFFVMESFSQKIKQEENREYVFCQDSGNLKWRCESN